eukprot:CAMPEP_0173384350 /NCGR_PEP_ID=MMETSP1356-20130122/6936_1 /TAXON_ID=77927 ORGANISM="Hemiselmis virescens, Strain PCC157" /NCGR_SAMPLE_ID=MMETSP1356 /ASSEMBLY_ACC=CAM_ASM_000847 /LENGTH=45 /DNA_ID= /DNA_START= /DNA_END= /DNA_ORIENTATION=
MPKGPRTTLSPSPHAPPPAAAAPECVLGDAMACLCAACLACAARG